MSENQAVQQSPAFMQRGNTDLARTDQSINKNFLQNLIDSKKLPVHIKTVEDAFTIGKYGKELGFPVMQALHFIIPINGRLTLTAKAIGAILRRNNVTMQTVEDALYIYRDGAALPYPRTIVNPVEDKPIDRRTTILFTRDGLPESVSFTWIDATTQELTGKDNWKRMPKEMLWARCLSKGANRLAQDYMLGLYSTDEMYDLKETNINESQVSRDEDGCISEINTNYVAVEEVQTSA